MGRRQDWEDRFVQSQPMILFTLLRSDPETAKTSDIIDKIILGRKHKGSGVPTFSHPISAANVLKDTTGVEL